MCHKGSWCDPIAKGFKDHFSVCYTLVYDAFNYTYLLSFNRSRQIFIKNTMNYIFDILYLDLSGQAQWWEEYEVRLEEEL